MLKHMIHRDNVEMLRGKTPLTRGAARHVDAVCLGCARSRFPAEFHARDAPAVAPHDIQRKPPSAADIENATSFHELCYSLLPPESRKIDEKLYQCIKPASFRRPVTPGGIEPGQVFPRRHRDRCGHHAITAHADVIDPEIGFDSTQHRGCQTFLANTADTLHRKDTSQRILSPNSRVPARRPNSLQNGSGPVCRKTRTHAASPLFGTLLIIMITRRKLQIDSPQGDAASALVRARSRKDMQRPPNRRERR